MMTANDATMPTWCKLFLRFTGVYNIAWGVALVAFPSALFRWSQLEPLNYPAFLQCLGVVLAAQGIGYWIAATDAATHWAVVATGLVAKLIWPLVFLFGTSSGDAPPDLGKAILLNDVAWWIPLFAVLLQAARVNEARRRTELGVTLEQALRNAVPEPAATGGQNLYELSFERPLLLICLRHLGCTFCREALGDLARQREQVQHSGVLPIVVSMATTEETAGLLARYGLGDVQCVSDPQRQLFAALQLPFGTLSQFISWSTLWRAVGEGVVFRHGFGGFVGNGLQLSGAFLVRNGRVERAERHANPAERTNFADLSCPITSATAP